MPPSCNVSFWAPSDDIDCAANVCPIVPLWEYTRRPAAASHTTRLSPSYRGIGRALDDKHHGRRRRRDRRLFCSGSCAHEIGDSYLRRREYLDYALHFSVSHHRMSLRDDARFVTLGMFIIDEFTYQDDEGKPLADKKGNSQVC